MTVADLAPEELFALITTALTFFGVYAYMFCVEYKKFTRPGEYILFWLITAFYLGGTGYVTMGLLQSPT